MYGSALGGFTYAVRQFYRAHHVAKYVETHNVEHLYLADVPTTEAPFARFRPGSIRARGAAAALGAPLLWLAWRAK